MPHYGKTSRRNLDSAHIDLQVIFETVLPEWDHSILCGHRGEAEQMEAFSTDKSKVKFPDSKHNSNPSMAVDAAPYPIDWDDRERFVAFGNYVLGVADTLLKLGKISHRVRWGGDWNHADGREMSPQNWSDMPHFELVPAV